MSWNTSAKLCIALIGIALVATSFATTNDSFSCIGKKDGNYANSKNCSTYIACSGHRLYVMPCPAGLHYNPSNDTCDYPEFVGCNDGNLCAGRPNGNIADPDNCRGYIACVEEISIKMPCPADLHYDAANDRCDYPHKVDCKGKPDSTPNPIPDPTDGPETTTAMPEKPITEPETTTIMPETTTVMPETTTTTVVPLPISCVTNPPGVYPDPTNCSRFVVCLGRDRGVLKSCSSKHLNFNPALKVCVWSNTYTCVGSNFCVGKDDGDYKDVNNCFGYISCVAGLGYPRNCGSPLSVFDGAKCVHGSTAKC